MPCAGVGTPSATSTPTPRPILSKHTRTTQHATQNTSSHTNNTLTILLRVAGPPPGHAEGHTETRGAVCFELVAVCVCFSWLGSGLLVLTLHRPQNLFQESLPVLNCPPSTVVTLAGTRGVERLPLSLRIYLVS